MKNKKNLNKLFDKPNKKKKPTTASAAKEDEDPNKLQAEGSSSVAPDTPNDQPSPAQTQDSSAKAAPRDTNDESSDDELGYQLDIKNKIVDKQADATQEQDVVEMPEYMKQKDEKDDAAAGAQKNKVKRNDGSNIKFTGKPIFRNKAKEAGAIGGDDFQGLDEIGDDGKQKKA